ncbi:MAG: hypothetical protein ABI232_03330, partial [Jatrophihabitantaceae bacterium]
RVEAEQLLEELGQRLAEFTESAQSELQLDAERQVEIERMLSESAAALAAERQTSLARAVAATQELAAERAARETAEQQLTTVKQYRHDTEQLIVDADARHAALELRLRQAEQGHAAARAHHAELEQRLRLADEQRLELEAQVAAAEQQRVDLAAQVLAGEQQRVELEAQAELRQAEALAAADAHQQELMNATAQTAAAAERRAAAEHSLDEWTRASEAARLRDVADRLRVEQRLAEIDSVLEAHRSSVIELNKRAVSERSAAEQRIAAVESVLSQRTTELATELARREAAEARLVLQPVCQERGR